MKKVWMFGLVMILLMVPVTAFAEELPEDWETIRLEQVAEYTPENYDEWVRLFESSEVLKAERESLKDALAEVVENVWKPYIEALKGEAKSLMAAYRETLKEQVESGAITLEEAKVLFEEQKTMVFADLMLMKDEHEAIKAERAADQIYYDELRATRRGINESIKQALVEEAYDLIPGYLNTILLINQELENHAIDVNEEIQEKIDELNSL